MKMNTRMMDMMVISGRQVGRTAARAALIEAQERAANAPTGKKNQRQVELRAAMRNALRAGVK